MASGGDQWRIAALSRALVRVCSTQTLCSGSKDAAKSQFVEAAQIDLVLDGANLNETQEEEQRGTKRGR